MGLCRWRWLVLVLALALALACRHRHASSGYYAPPPPQLKLVRAYVREGDDRRRVPGARAHLLVGEMQALEAAREAAAGCRQAVDERMRAIIS